MPALAPGIERGAFLDGLGRRVLLLLDPFRLSLGALLSPFRARFLVLFQSLRAGPLLNDLSSARPNTDVSVHNPASLLSVPR
jgi:hypothetical protein